MDNPQPRSLPHINILKEQGKVYLAPVQNRVLVQWRTNPVCLVLRFVGRIADKSPGTFERFLQSMLHQNFRVLIQTHQEEL